MSQDARNEQQTESGPLLLLRDLIEARTFEHASALTLRRVLDICAAELASSAFASHGKIERAMIHLRPGGAYRHLILMAAGDSAASIPHDGGRLLFSSTAWRWVVEQRHPISIDVNLARVCLNPQDGSGIVRDTRLGDAEPFEHKSQTHLKHREVTHVLAVPLRVAGGAVEGMISIEAQCQAAMGLPFVWPQCAARIQALCDIAAPYLVALPSGPAVLPSVDAFLPVIGRSMAPTIELLQVFAQQSDPILLGGPTGSGKSRLARWCHEHSPLRDRPFEVLDLSAVPEDLQMAELFGWKRGAFTGAVRDNAGLVARAQGGTLFIDEIGNLSQRAQAGLLHVLEEGTYRVLGEGGGEKTANVRFLLGTNEDLQEAVRSRRFREDLYYRINVLPVSLPPLRDRADEIPLWANYMLNRRHRANGHQDTVDIDAQGQAGLLKEQWPGNLRQLDNIIRRAYAIALMSRGAAATDGKGEARLVLKGDHIKRAITYESPVRNTESFQSLLAAAAAFVSQATDRQASDREPGSFMELDLVEGFKGLVLCSALERVNGNLDEVFRLFGRDKLVASRNHHRAFRREIERAQQLHAALSGTEFPFAKFLDPTDDDGAAS